METIQRKEQTSSNSPQLIRNTFKKFLASINNLSQVQKVKMVYTYLAGHKPDPNLKPDKILNRVLYELEFGEKIKETKKALESEKKQFKWNAKQLKQFKASKKKNSRNKVLLFYLNIKGEIETPRLYPLYSGNMVIIKNKPYEVDPRAFWNMGKYKCMVFKEIDRRPVSNLNYDEIKRRGDATDSDEFLIKAAMKAIQGGLKKPLNRGAIVLIVIAVLVMLGFFFFSGGGA